MIKDQGWVDAWLMAELPLDGPSAAAQARSLFGQVEYLTWPDRVKELDRFFWKEANERLGHGEVTAVINRQLLGPAEARAAERYVQYAKCILTAVLMRLDERPPVASVWQGMTWLLGQRAREHELATAWLRGADPAALRAHLARLPGYAFLVLAATQDDTVESFLARDAFWDAMLGATRDVGGDPADRDG